MPLDTKSFDLIRSLPLNAATLWPVLTDPAHRQSWSAPSADMVLTFDTADLREGGQDRQFCGDVTAPDFVIETRWYKLVPHERAVFTETLLIGGESLFTSLVTYVLEPKDAATNLHLTVAVSSFEGADALAEVRDGWDGGLANLDVYIASLEGKG